MQKLISTPCSVVIVVSGVWHVVVHLTRWGPSPLREGCHIKAPECTFPAICVVLMEENAVLHEKLLFLPWSHTTSFSSVAVNNVSAACRVTAVLHIAEVERYGFSPSFEGQDQCYMVSLPLPLGVSEMKPGKWDKLSPCLLLWVNIPLNAYGSSPGPICSPHVWIKGNIPGCCLFLGGVFSPSGRGGSYFKALIFQLISLSGLGQNPLIHHCVGPSHAQD